MHWSRCRVRIESRARRRGVLDVAVRQVRKDHVT